MDEARVKAMQRVESMVEVERRAIVQALRACHGSRDGAAYALNIGRSTLYRKIRELDIDPDEYMASLGRAA